MKLTRRNALIGMGTVAAGAGAIGGSGAFTSVTAERTVNVSTAGDANAALSLEPTDSENASAYVTVGGDNGDTIQLDLDGTQVDSADSTGLNENAKTRIDNLIKITNNGSQDINSISLDLTYGGDKSGIGGVFKFTVGSDGGNQVNNGNQLNGGSGIAQGNELVFGIIIDLLNNGNGIEELPSDDDYTLTITANA